MLPKHLQLWLAPAKLNLFLLVLRQRQDGYHNLQTLFQLLDYGDSLAFSVREDGGLRRQTDFPAVPENDDLCVRAADVLQRESNTPLGADIFLEKKIPLGGGLGGGSSDAATTLVALNQLWNCGYSKDELAIMGRELGADVPVFVYGATAWAEGIGEKLTPVSLAKRWYVVIKPPVAVSTSTIFNDPELTRDGHPITIADFMARGSENVFQPLVSSRYPEVQEAIDWLEQFAPAKMTGTGSCVFAALESRFEARNILDQLPAGLTGFVAPSMQYSPLYLL